MAKPFYSIPDIRRAAKWRLPKMMFDFLDGASGEEDSCKINIEHLEQMRLLPRTLVNTDNRQLGKTLFGQEWSLPFGIAPMGMCNLVWPDADKMLASAAVEHNIPVVLSTMASTTIESFQQTAKGTAWFQLYVGQSEELGYEMVDRASAAGYETLVLTVDVPMPGFRPRELRNGFKAPIKLGPKQVLDFALHPQWSISTLLKGVPKVANNSAAETGKKFVRNESRGKVDWGFLERLRRHWKGTLIVKGVLSPEDSAQIKATGADGVWVSNHGGRQLQSAPATIDRLPLIREAVGDDFPVLFDSGVRNGEAIVKALAAGADFVFLGRPFLYAIGADGEDGLRTSINLLKTQIDLTLAQVGRPDVNDLSDDLVQTAR